MTSQIQILTYPHLCEHFQVILCVCGVLLGEEKRVREGREGRVKNYFILALLLISYDMRLSLSMYPLLPVHLGHVVTSLCSLLYHDEYSWHP